MANYLGLINCLRGLKTVTLFMSCWFPSLLILFCIIGWLMEHIYPHSLCFSACPPWAISVSTWSCYLSRGSQASENLQVSWLSFLPRLPSDFLPWRLGWTSYFLCFARSKTCSFMGLGPFLLTFNGFGPSLFIESLNGS